MNEESNRQPTLSRRQFIATSIGVSTSLLLTLRAGSQPPAESFPDATPDVLLDSILAEDNPEGAIDALVEVFARSGIAVFDDAVTQPLIAPVAPVSPLSFQRWQLAWFVSNLTSGGGPASAFDEIFPTTTESGESVLTIGEMIAGYYAGATTPGAEFTRAFLNRVFIDSLDIRPGDIPTPAVITALLGGEIMGQMYEASVAISHPTIIAGGLIAGPVMMPSYQVPGIPLPGLPEIPNLPNVPVPAVPAAGNGICSTAQSFIATVQQRLFSVLQTAPETIDVPVVREIVLAVSLGIQIGVGYLLKTVDTLLAPVMNVLKSIAAGLAIASQIVGTISPWTVALDMRPAQNRFGIGAEVITGEIGVRAGGWDRIQYPDVVRNCASAIGITLPTPTAKDSPVSMWVSQSRPLLSLQQTTAVLDANGQATITYITGTETPEQAQGDVQTGIAWIRATVERDDLKRLRDQLFNLLFSQLPSYLEQIVRPLIGPTATSMSDGLIALASVEGTEPLYISYHEAKEEPDQPDPPDGEEESDCFPGTFQVADPAIVLRMAMPGPAQVTVDGGRYVMDFQPGGVFAGTYEDLTISVSGGIIAFTYTFNGTQGGTYTAESGVLTLRITSENVTMTADMIAVEGEESGMLAGEVSGAYTCGTNVLWQIPIDGLGTVPYELVPIS